MNIRELAEKILHHKRLYYAGKPEISDNDYDKLETELRRLDPEHPALETVGTDSDSTNKVKHATPMLSLNKTYKNDELHNWRLDRPVVGTLKIDGNSLSLVYSKGKLQLGKTRGNGREGEDVSTKIKWVSSVPKNLPQTVDIEVRGELYCSAPNFAKLCKVMESRRLERPTSPRNIVAGILGRKTDIDLAHYFDFYAFELIDPENALQLTSEMRKFEVLSQFGFVAPRHELLNQNKQVEEFLDSVLEEMESGPVSLDGAVFSFEDLKLHSELGHTSHHPRYKMSFKWQGDTATSVIEKIHWATSRHGIVTPVAVIDPVELSGARITNITLHNAAMVSTYNLKPGDEIELVRSGEVIPKFLRVVREKKGDHTWPKNCPACNSLLSFDEVRLVCKNSSECPAQQTGQILNWIKSVGIDDLSEKRLEHMMEIGFVSQIPDLYRISEEQMLQLPLTKEKMARKLLKNIQDSKNVELPQFLKGLGISGAGSTTWEKILAEYPELKILQKITAEQLVAIDGFAEKSAEQIITGLSEKRALIDELLAVGVIPKSVAIATGGTNGTLSGGQFVITGTLSRPRAEIALMIKQAGGKVASSVSSKTTALITNDDSTTSSKMKKATELGVPIWNEDQLAEQINS